MAVMVIVIGIRVAVVMMVAVVMAVIMAAAVVMAPGKGSEKNPEKSFPCKKREIPLGIPNVRRNACGGDRYTY